jgi:hypothetical protein
MTENWDIPFRDELFLADWIARGLTDLESYLDRHARFADYCERRERPARAE